MKIPNRLRYFAYGLGGLVIGNLTGVFLCFAWYASIAGPRTALRDFSYIAGRATDPILNTQSERELEERLGKPVYFDFGVFGNARDRRITHLDSVLAETASDLDYFDVQFSQIREIGFRRFGLEKYKDEFGRDLTMTTGARANSSLSSLEINVNEPLGKAILFHELPHFWHYHVDEVFNQKWLRISENHYLGDDHVKATREDMIKNGSLSKRSLINIREDVAEASEWVSTLNYLNRRYIDYEMLPKFVEKLALLRDYKFISNGEYRMAMAELRFSYVVDHPKSPLPDWLAYRF